MADQRNPDSSIDGWAAQLAQLDEQAEAGQRPAPADETIENLKAELDTIVATLRREPQPSEFDRETGCGRLTEWVRAIGHNPEELTEQTIDHDSDPRRTALASDSVPLGTIGVYELVSKLGEGGMGAVYKARHTKLDKIVAIKVLPSERMKDTSAVARFEREMRAVGMLEHPNIVRAMDAGEAGGTHYLVMEYVQGIDLAQLVKRHGPLRIADACELVRQAAVGLEEAHDSQMVHRDIKPSNIMLCTVGKRKPPVVKILDMGLALLSEAHSADVHGLTSTGQVMGTLDYMAPEQGGDSKSVDIRADIYALGATLYKLLCGEAIYHGENYQTPVQKLMGQAMHPAPPIQQRRQGVPDALATVLHRMLEKDPSQRIATPSDVVNSLAPFCGGANLAALLNDVGFDIAPTQDTPLTETATSPTAPATSSAGRRLPPWVPSVVGGGLLGSGGIAALLLASVFFFQTPSGMLRVEINDPDVKVEVMAAGIVVTEKDKEPVTVEAGDHTLKISHGDFSFTSDAFTVKKGEEVVVTIERLEATIKVSKADGEPLGEGIDKRIASVNDRIVEVDNRIPAVGGETRSGVSRPVGERVVVAGNVDGLPHGAIRAMDVSPNDTLIAAAFSTGRLAILHSATFAVKSVIGDGTAAITNPHWSPDGRFLAVAAGQELQILKPDGTVAVRVVGAPLQFFQWHPESRWLVTASSQHGTTKLWFVDPETSKTVEYDRGEVRGGLGGMEWSRDGKRLLASCSSGIVLFDEDGKVSETIPHEGLLAATWHPDGEHFLAAASAAENTRQIVLLDRQGKVVETQHDIGRGLTSFMTDPELGILEVASDVIRYGWKGEKQRFGVHGLFSQRHQVHKRPGAVSGYAILSPKLEHAPLLPHVNDIADDGTPRPPRQFSVVSHAIAWNADGTELLAAPQNPESDGALVALDPTTGEVVRTLGQPNPE